MGSVAVLGPPASQAYLAAQDFANGSEVISCADLTTLFTLLQRQQCEYALFTVYNTREGERKQHFRFFDQIRCGYWVDNVVLSSQLSLGVADAELSNLSQLRRLIGRREIINQCEEFIDAQLAHATTVSVQDMAAAVVESQQGKHKAAAVVEREATLLQHGFRILERDIAPYNRTRYAIFGHELAPISGYDATVLITEPLDDRLGLLVDILSEFSSRGINILDLRSENDVKTQKLRIYIEAEGHIAQPSMAAAVQHIESRVIQQPGALRLLGSFPRVDMRPKHIKTFGFIGTGDMSRWFADRLKNEGYDVLLTGRSSELRPKQMIDRADVVVICVPISVTEATIRQYGPLLRQGQALLLLAGASEATIDSALRYTDPAVELMLVHNLWGPRTATMRDKNAIVVRTPRSGLLCGEFEAFLYKHGAAIYQDSPSQHDLLMGIGQRLPTVVSVALAMTLRQHGITNDEIDSHCSLTSLYPILAMARVHSQQSRTYAEIMATSGEGRKIVHDFAKNVEQVTALADAADLAALCKVIEENAAYLSEPFLQTRMRQAKAVDEVLRRLM